MTVNARVVIEVEVVLINVLVRMLPFVSNQRVLPGMSEMITKLVTDD